MSLSALETRPGNDRGGIIHYGTVTTSAPPIITGITGTIRAGKGSVAEILVAKYGFKHFSVRTFLIEELIRRQTPVSRDTMTPLANELREEHGAQYIVQQLHQQAAKAGGHAIIESIRNVGEVEYLSMFPKSFLIGVDADIGLRFQRALAAESETDKDLTFEKFVADEERESTSTDPNSQNLRACMALANATIRNEGSMQDLEREVRKLYGRMMRMLEA